MPPLPPKISTMFRGEMLDVHKCQKWLDRFRNGDLSLKNKPRGHRQSVVDNDALNAIIETDPRQTLEELSVLLN